MKKLKNIIIAEEKNPSARDYLHHEYGFKGATFHKWGVDYEYVHPPIIKEEYYFFAQDGTVLRWKWTESGGQSFRVLSPRMAKILRKDYGSLRRKDGDRCVMRDGELADSIYVDGDTVYLRHKASEEYNKKVKAWKEARWEQKEKEKERRRREAQEKYENASPEEKRWIDRLRSMKY